MLELTTEQTREGLGRPGVHLVDARPVDAYNGWRLSSEPRGGHIAGARSLPRKWAAYIDWLDIVQSKGIRPDDTVIVYGYDRDGIFDVAERFRAAGYDDVRLYRRFADEWSAGSDLPMSRLERYRHLVSARWLDTLLRTGGAPEYDGARFVVCHAHYRNRQAYDEGHVPGAIELDTNTLESSETWNRRSSEELKQTLEQLGISSDTTVILYGRFAFPKAEDEFPGSSAGHLGAFRCALIMMYAGVRDVRILNGGLQAWLDEGLPVSVALEPKRPIADFGASIPQRPELMIDMKEAKEVLRSPDRNLVCVRSWREYIGEVSGYNYFSRKGRIPGAVFGNCGSDPYHMENYRNLDHTTRESREIEDLWAASGVTPDKYNAFYCGTGWRASEAFFNAWLMGWPRIAVFDGGWFEWSNDQNNPFETGLPHSSATPFAAHVQRSDHG